MGRREDHGKIYSTRLRVEGIKLAMEEMRKRYVPESASTFDVAEALPRVHDAIFASEFEGRPNPFNSGIQRAEVHAMLYAKLSGDKVVAVFAIFFLFSPIF